MRKVVASVPCVFRVVPCDLTDERHLAVAGAPALEVKIVHLLVWEGGSQTVFPFFSSCLLGVRRCVADSGITADVTMLLDLPDASEPAHHPYQQRCVLGGGELENSAFGHRISGAVRTSDECPFSRRNSCQARESQRVSSSVIVQSTNDKEIKTPKFERAAGVAATRTLPVEASSK